MIILQEISTLKLLKKSVGKTQLYKNNNNSAAFRRDCEYTVDSASLFTGNCDTSTY
ncbi:Uncharacterised protein [Legionella pneumophila]|nr:Uncharacterised protein [Legionella pneumophila]